MTENSLDETGRTMRCADATKEIAAPSGLFPRADLDRHLSECAACSSFARASAELDRAWAATRPAEPTSEDFDALWSAAVAASQIPETIPISRFVSVRGALWSAVLTASAAAALFLLRVPGSEPGRPGPASVVALAEIPIEQDAICVIRINDDGVEVDHIDLLNGPASLRVTSVNMPPLNDFDALSSLESMAE